MRAAEAERLWLRRAIVRSADDWCYRPSGLALWEFVESVLDLLMRPSGVEVAAEICRASVPVSMLNEEPAGFVVELPPVGKRTRRHPVRIGAHRAPATPAPTVCHCQDRARRHPGCLATEDRPGRHRRGRAAPRRYTNAQPHRCRLIHNAQADRRGLGETRGGIPRHTGCGC